MARATAHDDGIETCGLTVSELEELWLGPGHRGSLFSSQVELRDAWDRGREVVMRLWAHSGKRPIAWWCLEAPDLGLQFPGYDRQPRYLYEAGVLEEAERGELLRAWRQAFERGQEADIPPALLRQWKRQSEKKRPRAMQQGPEESA
jgi:hypothetical protein